MISVVNVLRNRQGFTLIELMIVVAILGILSSIAIPNMMKFQLRTRASEGRLNLSSIRSAQKAYFSETGFFQAWPLTPAAPPDAQKRPWTSCPNSPPQLGDPGYCAIGWFPEGDVYYNYIVSTNAPANQFFAVGESDIDGDGSINVWRPGARPREQLHHRRDAGLQPAVESRAQSEHRGARPDAAPGRPVQQPELRNPGFLRQVVRGPYHVAIGCFFCGRSSVRSR